ncbi:MAG: NACHT domain-containing protein, partial [bacterium]|nr:NACHT domain-containing protein [bacterium]
ASATADLHNWVAARWISLEEGLVSRPQPAAVADADRTNLLRLLERIQHDWIDGVLEASLHRRAWLDLGLDWQDEAVEQPWDRILVAPDRPVQTLGQRETIADVFAAAQNTLLILGEPGAGKTTTLLELVRDLARRARDSAAEPPPVVLALSTWTGRHRSLQDWLTEELNVRYQVPKRLARGWLEAGRLVLLLDGLDEVREALRPACVAAINVFAQEHMPAGLAVTCRVTEYSALPERLRLRSAICLQPLTPAQIDAYFERAGAGLENLRAAMREDEALRTLALMLSVMTMAWRDAPAAAWHSGEVITLEQRRRQLFDAYVQTALRRKGAREGEAFARHTLEVLPWLARQMRLRDQTLFAIEQMQPDWLEGSRRQQAYFLLTRLIATLGLALPFCLFPVSFGAKLAVLVTGVVAGLATTGLDFWLFGRDAAARPISPRDRALACAFLLGLVPVFGLPLIFRFAGISLPTDSSATLAVYGLLFAASMSIPIDVKTRDIRAADAVGWSWSQAARRAGLTIMTWQWFLISGGLELSAIEGWVRASKEYGIGQPGFWPGLAVGLLAGAAGFWRWRQRGWLVVAGTCALGSLGAELGQFLVSRGSGGLLIATLLLALLVGLFGGLSPGLDKTRAGRTGAWFWLKVPVLTALIVGLCVGSLLFVIGTVLGGRSNYQTGALISLAVGGTLGVVAFFRFGGFQGAQHFVLRRLLVQSGRRNPTNSSIRPCA